MGTRTLAVLTTIAFSVIGVLGITFSNSPAAASSRYERVGFTLASPSTHRPRLVGCS